jgi:hypothetical protein
MATAQEIAAKYLTPRYLRMERHERYVDGTQYQGLVPFMAQGEDAPPLHERAPCVKRNVVKSAIGDLVDFMLGEGRYPHLSANSEEDDEELDDEWGLDEDDSELLERWLNGPLTRAARLKAIFPDALTMAMESGSVAMVAAIRNGLPTLTALPGKWCTPTFDPATNEVVSLEVFYPYLVEVFDKVKNKWEEECKLYRRVIDATSDTVYLPGDGREDGKMPSWSVDNAQTAVHGLGYCPVRWYAFDRITPTAAHFDGKPIHKALHNEVDGLNLALSQRHRAALYAGDPQIWETGVEEGVNPAPSGRVARAQIEAQAADASGRTVGIFTASPQVWGRGSARKKGPGVVWRYPTDTAKVGMLTLPTDALGGITEHARDVQQLIAEDLSVILMDPSDTKAFGAMSGKALAFLFARQIARADRIRLDAGDNLILTCVDLLLRLCLSVNRNSPGGLRIPGMKRVAPLLEKFERDVQLAGTPMLADMSTVRSWFGPPLSLQWGPYFASSAEEQNFIVTLCAAAYSGGLMPLSMVLERLREVFPFGSTEELIAKIDEEKAKKQADALANQDAMMAMSAKHAAPQPGGGNPDAPPKSGGFGKAPPPKAGAASGARGDTKA